MPSFWDKYNTIDTVIVDEGDGADSKIWVKVKRHPMRGASRAAQTRLVSPIMRFVGAESDTRGEVDTGGYQNELVCWQVVDWNIPAPEGDGLLPLGTVDPEKGPDAVRRASVDELPEEVFTVILQAIEGNTPKKAAKPGEPQAEDPFREGDTSGAVAGRKRA